MNELMINLRAEQKVPLYEQIYDYIKDDIKKGRIQSGEKLPSTRALSAHLEVSRSTVELAYEQLLSEGYIEAQPYRGYFVCQIDGLFQIDAQENNKRENNEQREQKYPESVLWMIRQNCFVSAALRENMDLEMLYAVTFIRPEE